MDDKIKSVEEEAAELKILCKLFGLNLKDLITKIDVFSQDYQGRKVVIGKRLYSAEDLVLGRANDIFHTILINAIQNEFKVTSNDIMHFGYPDRSMNIRTIVIHIAHYIEKDNKTKES